MDIKNVTLKQKRYSTYGWNDVNSNREYINTLSQGEIGVLLGSNGQPVESLDSNVVLDSVLEVRIGTVDNQYFFDALLISTGGQGTIDYCVKTFTTYSKLPSFGNLNSLYVVKDENSIYRWDDDISQMVKVTGSGSDWHDIERIDGGNSSSGLTTPEY